MIGDQNPNVFILEFGDDGLDLFGLGERGESWIQNQNGASAA